MNEPLHQMLDSLIHFIMFTHAFVSRNFSPISIRMIINDLIYHFENKQFVALQIEQLCFNSFDNWWSLKWKFNDEK